MQHLCLEVFVVEEQYGGYFAHSILSFLSIFFPSLYFQGQKTLAVYLVLLCYWAKLKILCVIGKIRGCSVIGHLLEFILPDFNVGENVRI